MQEFLMKTECHFNWNLAAIDVSKLNMVEKFRDKIEENQSLDDPSEMIWPLKLTYAYELLATDRDASVKVVEDVINEITEAKDGLTSEYRISYNHIAYSFKAFTQVQTQGHSAKVVDLIKRIKPVAEMTRVERSAILAMKAQVLRYYGPNGIYMCVPLLRQAIQLNPEEIEFKLSLVVCMNRKRHYDTSSSHKMPWSDIEEPVSILEHLLNHPKLTSHQRVSCEYFLAFAYSDFLRTLKPYSPEYKDCKLQILKSCDWIHDKSNHPQIMSFCADKFFFLENNTSKGLSVIESALTKFPFHVGVNTKACNLYNRTNNLESAAKHAQIALDGGGFGAAWLLLKIKTQLNEQFDEDGYFNKLLQFFPKRYTMQIHLQACLYYMQKKYDVVKGARHMEMMLIEDPSYDSLKSCFCHYTSCVVSPLEIVYVQIVEALKTTDHSREDLSTLRRTKDKIEEFADVGSFNLTIQTGASCSKRKDKPVGAKTAPMARGAAHRAPIRGFGKDRTAPVDGPSASTSKSPLSTSSKTRKDAYKSEKGSVFQRMSETTQGASTYSRSGNNLREAESSFSSAFRTKCDLNTRSGSRSSNQYPNKEASESKKAHTK